MAAVLAWLDGEGATLAPTDRAEVELELRQAPRLLIAEMSSERES